MSIEDACKTLAVIVPKVNDAIIRKVVPHYLGDPSILHLLGVSDSAKTIHIEFVSSDGKARSVDIAVKQQGGETQMVVAVDPGSEKPLYMRNQGASYWAELIDNGKVVFFQYNRCRSDADYPFEKMQERLEQMLAQPGVERLVIDLRHNGGGASSVLDPFISWLAKNETWNVSGRTVVLIGRRTFSSAILNAMCLRRDAHAVLIGEPTSGKPNHYGEVESFQLPNCGWEVSYSTKHFRYSQDDTPSLMPDVVVEMTSSDHFAGRDPALDTALAYTAD